MNVKNNKRRRESVMKIENVFVELLQTKELEQISVSEICKKADINRSTFYANFVDIYDLAEKIIARLWEEFLSLYANEAEEVHKGEDVKSRMDFTKLFIHISENQLLYKTYFKLGDMNLEIVGFDEDVAELFFDMKYIDYHIEFFKHGLNAIIKKWLSGGCKETPEQMQSILHSEYRRDYSLLK